MGQVRFGSDRLPAPPSFAQHCRLLSAVRWAMACWFCWFFLKGFALIIAQLETWLPCLSMPAEHPLQASGPLWRTVLLSEQKLRFRSLGSCGLSRRASISLLGCSWRTCRPQGLFQQSSPSALDLSRPLLSEENGGTGQRLDQQTEPLCLATSS